MTDKTKVLWVTDTPNQPSGYGIVGRNVLSRLAASGKYEVHALGLQHGGQSVFVSDPDTKVGYWLHPRGGDGEGYDIIQHWLQKIKPGVLITLRDVGLQAGYVRGIQAARQKGWKGKWLAYTPFDSHVICHDWFEIVKMPDLMVTMSEWGKRICKDQLKTGSYCIPHGVDTEIFKPLPREDILSRKSDHHLSEMFVVGAVGRNQHRKMWAYLMQGFGIFQKEKNNVHLVCHTDPTSVIPFGGWSLHHLKVKYGFPNKFSVTYDQLNPITRFLIEDKQMNQIHNSFDVFCFPTGGEGFGIPILEALSCGRPVITTAYTTGFELIREHGELVQPLKDKHGNFSSYVGENGVEFVVPDYVEIAEKLQKLYDSESLRRKYAEQGRAFAVENYDWSRIIPLWERAIDESVAGNIDGLRAAD